MTATEMSITGLFRCEENDSVELKAYVPASGNRPSPKSDTLLAVGLTVGCFAAMNSNCHGSERTTHDVPDVSCLPLPHCSFESNCDGDIRLHQLSDRRSTLRKPRPLLIMQLRLKGLQGF